MSGSVAALLASYGVTAPAGPFSLALAGPAATTGSGATIASVFGASTPIGTLHIAVITQSFGANSPKTITNVRDNIDGANNYTLLAEANNGTLYVHIYGRVATAAGTRTVTCTFSGTADASIAVNAYASTGGFTADVTSTNQGTGTAITPGSASPTGVAMYIAAAVWTNGTGTALTQTGGWNARQKLESGSASLIAVQDLFGSGAQNPAMTLAASQDWVAAIATYH